MASPSTLSREQLRDRIRGCLYGNAVGDAYGLATEFMSPRQAKDLYGNGPIAFGNDPGWPVWEDGHRPIADRNDFTDDTDQMLILLQALMTTSPHQPLSASLFAKKMLEWNDFGFPELGTPSRGIGYTVMSVMDHAEFKTNPHLAAYEVWDRESRQLAANGAVMRTAVVGVESFWDERRVVRNAITAAKITHADPRSIIAALVSSVLISRMLRGGGESLERDAATVWNPALGSEAYRQGLLRFMRRGSDPEAGVQDEEDIEGILPSLDGSSSSLEGEEEQEEEHAVFHYKDFSALEKIRLEEEEAEGGNYKAQFRDRDSMDWNRNRPRAVLRDSIGWAGVDGVGADAGMFALAQSVVDDYTFLLLDTDLVPEKKMIEENLEAEGPSYQEQWTEELIHACFPPAISNLDLGSARKMGYAYKTIGVSVYAVTRQIDANPTSPEYQGPQGLFRGLMEQVTLEAGDADTNCAVMGSLLGARFGLRQGVPEAWWTALQHRTFFERTVNAFADRVLDNFEAYQQQQLLQQ
ncbi:hypothetical protein EMPS_08286 [Entomortierella parvispora]|uniref:ADP-ribosylglycohydrolase n=1 Tax=Entomortierella parvispora TaxID=205924 RepID=A0A9P3HG30_9FUNG|nr:hypothetical protein EMPS_08286 [Entomortierella parvispora]